jgi:hypothetical protein
LAATDLRMPPEPSLNCLAQRPDPLLDRTAARKSIWFELEIGLPIGRSR